MRELFVLFLAHSFYSQACCGGSHCHPVPCEEVIELPDGGVNYHNAVFDKIHVHPSEDARCHVCMNGQTPLCAYIRQDA
jgi:hypothetical protein